MAKNALGRLQRTVSLAEGAKPGLPHIKVVSIDPGSVRVEIQVCMHEWEIQVFSILIFFLFL